MWWLYLSCTVFFFFYCSVNIVKLCLHLNINNPLRQQLNLCTDSHQALCSLLRRDASINFKAKGNSLVSVLACNLLMAAYEEDENWPKIFVKVRKHFVLFVLFPSTFDALWIMICVYLWEQHYLYVKVQIWIKTF